MLFRSICASALLLAAATTTFAQAIEPLAAPDFDADGVPQIAADGTSNSDIAPWENYRDYIKKRAGLHSAGPDAFGDAVGLSNGSLSFSVTDLSIPGNSALPVAITRTFEVAHRPEFYLYDRPMTDWDLELPRIHGVYGQVWDTDRCTRTFEPRQIPVAGGAVYQASDFWQGLTAAIPAGGELLVASAATPRPSVVPSTVPNGGFVWLTPGMSYIACLPSIQNATGEGFLAITPDGTTYRFDWMAMVYEAPLSSPASTVGQTGPGQLPRRRNVMYATRVEDRFGHWVDYTYTNAANQPPRLTRILADDGREITLAYNPHGKVSSVSSHGRTWIYGYNPAVSSLTSVTLPDSSRWTLDLKAISDAQIDFSRGDPRTCTSFNTILANPEITGTITHPAGATGEFVIQHALLGRSNVPLACFNYQLQNNNPNDDVAVFVRDSDNLVIKRKTVTGPGIEALQWTYEFGANRSFIPGSGPVCNTPGCADPVCVTDSCAGSVTAVVQGPDSDYRRYKFGNSYRYNEGKLISVERGTSENNILQVETTGYQLAQSGQSFATPMGRSLRNRGDGFISEYQRPKRSHRITRDGVNFDWTANSFDAYARANNVTKASSLGYSRTEAMSYFDDLAKWVIGQVESVTVGSDVPSQTTFDASTVLPTHTYAFGKLQQRFTYHSTAAQAGLVNEVFDGGDTQKTTLDSYKRGFPQSIVYHDTTTESAVVNDRGEIDSVTDELGNKTCYGYDTMGRLTSLTYPSETTSGVCDASAWTATSSVFASVASVEYGVPANHWKQTETTGARKSETFYDGLWRPIFSRQSSTDASVGVRTLRKDFDHEDRETFVSYPGADVASYLNLSVGGRTDYDALGRVTDTHSDSELSPATINTSTDYLTGFVTQFTNARGFVTSTSYQAFDQPSTDAPMQISAPETQVTTYTRDVFGKPITMTRSGSYTPPSLPTENQTLTRRYVYDGFQRLCKTLEPESGVSILSYLDTGNVQWQAIGQNTLTSATTCQQTSVPAAQRSLNYYDARNRLTRIDHPTGSDDLGYSYENDGAVQTASIGTLDSAVPPNFASTKNSWTYGYNKRRLLTNETLSLDSKSFGLTWRYNPRGDQEGLVYPSGLDIGFLPNAYGEPRQAGPFASSVTRHPNGAINSLTYGNNLVQTTTQNLRQLPLRRTVGVVMDHTHLYDENANIVTLTDGSTGSAESRSLAYDGLDRMTTANAPAQLGNESYRFDALDNLRGASIGSSTFVHTVDSQNRLSQIQKDGALHVSYNQNAQGDTTLRNFAGTVGENIFANGFENVVLRTPEFAANQVLNYDRAHRLTSITGVESYLYDAHGRRVLTARATDGLKRYQLYSNAGVLMHTEDQRTSEIIDYVNLEGQLVAERTTPLFGGMVTTRYQHADLRGSPTVVSSAGGTQVERSIEQPFGAPYDGIYRDGPGFTGHATDAASGLTYMQQRYYDPVAMRFLSVDPAQSEFSRYSYGANNPFKFVDPDGRNFAFAWAEGVAAFAAADAVVPEPTDAAAGPKAIGYGVAILGLAVVGAGIDYVISESGEGAGGETGEGNGGSESGIDDARTARDQLASEVGASKATVTGGVNTETGQVAACANGGEGCAEDNVVRELGGDKEKVQFTEAIRPRTGEQVPVCERCEERYGRDKFPDGTRFKSDELPK